MIGRVTGVEKRITATDEAETQSHTDTQTNRKAAQMYCETPPANCDGPTGMPNNDAAGC